MLKHIRYGLAALLFLVVIALLMQYSERDEIVPAGNCKPETCEFKLTEYIKLGET